MTYYALLFIAGFAGHFHCIGMCGGFACALGADPDAAPAPPRSVICSTTRAGCRATVSSEAWLAGWAR